MNTHQNSINEIITQLRARGMRMTPQRMAVLNTLVGNREHLSAEAIYERVRGTHPMIGLATVYKTVAMLKKMGVVNELNFNKGQALYDGSGGEPHPHFVCTQCNCIIDIEGESIDTLSTEIAQKTGYEINNYRLDFFGVCPECQ
jgi:Fur family peroxide stress response transcriptional regulator